MHEVILVPDSFVALRNAPEDLVDVTITDPPYAAHVQKNLCSGSLVGKKSVPKYELPFEPLSGHAFVGDLLRMTRRWVVVFCAVEDFGRLQDLYPEEYVRGCLFIKTNAMGQLTADRPATSYEGIALFHKKATRKRWNGRGSYGVWVCPGTRGLQGRHPNQKPALLCEKLVALFSERGETVFDPFCGSGAIGMAATDLGRNYVGWDNCPEWSDKARAALDGRRQACSDEDALKQCAARGLWSEGACQTLGES